MSASRVNTRRLFALSTILLGMLLAGSACTHDPNGESGDAPTTGPRTPASSPIDGEGARQRCALGSHQGRYRMAKTLSQSLALAWVPEPYLPLSSPFVEDGFQRRPDVARDDAMPRRRRMDPIFLIE